MTSQSHQDDVIKKETPMLIYMTIDEVNALMEDRVRRHVRLGR